MGGVWIGLRKKTPFGPIICQKIERLRKKRLFAGKRETAALEGDLFVITRRTGNKKPLQRTCKGIETGLPVHDIGGADNAKIGVRVGTKGSR